MTNPADLGAIEARSLIARKQLSPVELAEACIARVEAVDPAVNALIARDFDGLRKAAKQAEADVTAGKDLGALHGLPFGVKDMIDVTGLPTTFGSEAFKDNIATKDDAIVAAMRAAGGFPMGKTNNPEWSAGANTRNRVYGVTANPHDITRSCAGSSAARRWRWPAAMPRSPPARTPAAACATRRPFAASSAIAPAPAWCPATPARQG